MWSTPPGIHLDFMNGYYKYCEEIFNHDVIGVAQENFENALWFTNLESMKINYFMRKLD
jgi:hypothetical protein